MRALKKPTAPTRAQREEHEVSHIKFEAWCEHCQKGKGLNDPHRKLKKHVNDDVTPVVSMDFAFSKLEAQEGTSPVLVLRDHLTRMTFAHPVPGKSTVNEPYSRYTIDRVVQDLKIVDRKRCILQTDQEPAMLAPQEKVKQIRCAPGEHTVLENSPVAESQSNGVVEKAIQEVETQSRTMMSALRSRIKAEVPWNHPLALWLIEYAAVLINVYREGKDGRTPMERLRGQKHERPFAEYGERVLYMPLGDRPAFPEPRFQEGLWLGLDLRTAEVLIGTPTGVVRARTVKRRVEEDRWSAEEALAIRGTPWDPTPGTDPELLPTAVRRPPPADEPTPDRAPAEPGMSARRAPLRKADFMKYGYTDGCPACANYEAGHSTRVGHNELCRQRIEAELMKTDDGKARIDQGYGRIANAALRMEERDVRIAAQAVRDPTTEEGEAPRKRVRDVGAPAAPAPDPMPMAQEPDVQPTQGGPDNSGSTEGQPPGTDEAGMGAGITNDAASSSQTPKPADTGYRGMK